MMMISKHRAHGSIGILTGLVVTAVLLTMTGCVTGRNLGGYQGSNDVRQIFESYQVLPDHTYYITGSNVDPAAILAIDNRYTLTSADLWNKVTADQSQLRFWVDTMSRKIADMPRGYYVLAPSGNRMGVFYSSRGRGLVEMEGENKVAVYLPDEERDEYRSPWRLR